MNEEVVERAVIELHFGARNGSRGVRPAADGADNVSFAAAFAADQDWISGAQERRTRACESFSVEADRPVRVVTLGRITAAAPRSAGRSFLQRYRTTSRLR